MDVKKNDTISRQAALDAIGEQPLVWTDDDDYAQGRASQWEYDTVAIKALPSAQPEERELDESCTDCPLYDKERHSCPRFNKVIPETLRELQSAQPDSKDLIKKIQNGITVSDGNNEYFIGLRNGMRWCLSLIDDKEPIYESLAQPENIHCKDCKHWTQSTGKMKGYGLGRCDFHDADLVTCNGFCYWAERRQDADND